MEPEAITLPPLPEPIFHNDILNDPFASYLDPDAQFTGDQMHDYARAAVLQERERCARIAETKAEGIERVNTYRGKVNAVSQHAADMVADVASAIRSGTAPA